MFDLLNAVTCAGQDFAQHRLTLGERLSSKVFIVELQQVERAGCGSLVIGAAVQRLEIRHTIGVKPNDFSVKNRRVPDPRCILNNEGIASRPISPAHCVELYPPFTHMYLQPIAVMLQLMRPARFGWRSLRNDRAARRNESGRRIPRPTALAPLSAPVDRK
jgi:hypothetical protein